MNSETLLETLLVLHLTGLVLMAGTTFIDFLTFKVIGDLSDGGGEQARGLVALMARFSRLIGIGAALLIITGFGMMAVTKGVFGEQLWFRIKFALVILLVLNSLVIGRRRGLRFRKLVAENNAGQAPVLQTTISGLNWFYLSQLSILVIIIILSTFKFN